MKKLVLLVVLALTACSAVEQAPAAPATLASPEVFSGEISGVFTPEVQKWGREIVKWSSQYGIDPNMLATVVQIESCGDPNHQDSWGPVGLTSRYPSGFENGQDPFDPETNALNGLAYLRQALDAADGDPRLAFAGYNGGIGVIGKEEDDWASETQRYAYWGSVIYMEASSGAAISYGLQKWMAAIDIAIANKQVVQPAIANCGKY